MKKNIPWIKWDDTGMKPAFYKNDMVEAEYRDGRTPAAENEPYMFAGWNHNGGPNDIVAYRIVIKGD